MPWHSSYHDIIAHPKYGPEIQKSHLAAIQRGMRSGKTKFAIAFLLWPLLVGHVARAQICNPACANQPTKCCAQPQEDTFIAEECTSASSSATGLHFVLVDATGQKQFGFVEESAPAQFTVAGKTVTTALGNSGVFSVTLGASTASARFQVVDAITPLHFVGQCVTVKGNAYAGLVFPAMVVVQNRALLVSGRNPFYCKIAGSPDIMCFQVKGQVGAPFTAGQLCDPDRVEYACGVVA